MAVDGFTLVAQIVNFLILVYLLKRFLYRPILDAMDRREAGIAARLAEAEQREQEAGAERERLQQAQATLAEQRQQLLDQARTAADEQRQTQLAAAQHDIEQARHEWRLELHREREQFLQSLRRQLGTGVCELAHQALVDLADAELQDQVVAVFLRRLRELPESQRRSLAGAGEPPLIASAFELTASQREYLRGALVEVLGESVDPRFELQPALICGLVLQTAQGELGWHVAQYLDELESRLRDRLDGMATEETDDAVAEHAD